jgi:hypothetical protein
MAKRRMGVGRDVERILLRNGRLDSLLEAR